MQSPSRTLLAVSLLAGLTSGCGSMQQAESPVQAPESTAAVEAKVACGSFFVYDMCMTDRARDHRVDYVWFTDDSTIFMFQPGESLPADMPLHRCAVPMNEDVVQYSSQLLYGEELTLLEEMNVKRKLLVSFMAAKDEVDDCYGTDSSGGDRGGEAAVEFAADDYDWGED